MPTPQNLVTNLEAGRKIQEYLGEDTPESYFVHDNDIIWRRKEAGFFDKDPSKEYVPAFLFSELITDVLPKIVEKQKIDIQEIELCVNDLLLILDLKDGGMEAVSKRIINLINTK